MAINTPLTITGNVRCKDAIALLKREGFDMVPVLSADGAVIGVVTEGNITKCILSGRCDPDTTVADSGVIYKTFHKFQMHSTLHELAQALDHDPFVLIVTEQRCFSTPATGNGKKRKNSDAEQQQPPAAVTTRSVVSGIVSRIDLLDFISHGNATTTTTTTDAASSTVH
jgi:cystathionine beta-synthase